MAGGGGWPSIVCCNGHYMVLSDPGDSALSGGFLRQTAGAPWPLYVLLTNVCSTQYCYVIDQSSSLKEILPLYSEPGVKHQEQLVLFYT